MICSVRWRAKNRTEFRRGATVTGTPLRRGSWRSVALRSVGAWARSARRVSGRLPTALLGVLVTDRYKLVAGLEDGLFELYDVVADPHETHDLAGTDADVRQHLWRQLALAWDADYQGLDTE
jgi:arylsulfatase A-like enzyme